MKVRIFPFILFLAFLSCSSPSSEVEDRKGTQHLFFGGQIFSFEDSVHQYSAMLVENGRISQLFTETQDWQQSFPDATLHDLKGKVIYPGLHDAHAHFYGFGKGLTELDLVNTLSWEDVLSKLKDYAQKNEDAPWIIGRGWDQNDWELKEFPDNAELNRLFPNRSVVLTRIDGHALIANQKALEIAGLTRETKISGGELLLNSDGELTGVLIDNACDQLKAFIPEPSKAQIAQALIRAQKECLPNGITAITEPGLPLHVFEVIDSLTKTGLLRMRFNIMLNPESKEFTYAEEQGRYKTDHVNMRAFKIYIDGAMGSRGALLKEPYCDAPKKEGLMLTSPEQLKAYLSRIHKLGFQANTHCIGDSANALVLSAYADELGTDRAQRWRIEHAQIMDTADLHFYGDFGIIPSVQPTHATSDFPWVVDRLCEHRLPGAYAYKSLLKAAGVLPLGTDVPVESVNPFHTYLAAVYRMNKAATLPEKLDTGESLTHLETMKGMTYWAAWSSFMEKEYGSLQPGMFADFIILDQDLKNYPAEELLSAAPVMQTWINGEQVWSRP